MDENKKVKEIKDKDKTPTPPAEEPEVSAEEDKISLETFAGSYITGTRAEYVIVAMKEIMQREKDTEPTKTISEWEKFYNKHF